MARAYDDLWLRAAEPARSALGAVTQAGFQVKHRPWQAFEAGYRYYGRFALVLLLEGAGSYEDDRGTACDIEPGDLIVVLPDVGHRYGPRAGHGWREIFIVFEGPAFDQWYRHGLLWPDRLVLHGGSVERWAERLRRVLQPGASTQADALVEVCRVQQLLADRLASEAGLADSDSASPWLEQAIELIELTIPGTIDWDAIAERLHVSPATLRRRFRERLGISPGRYRTRRMIDRACELMQQTDMTDQQIAERLGFCDPYYFSRCFKQAVGRSPRAYRASLP
ncbi:MAG: helix-turn-helix domain-containing protein [Planctomycetes bacterium]|jgi:AraC-like DNA-binding protein|nr:helix-turn-helix domain-containing protein [Planctomycetota bacterium]